MASNLIGHLSAKKNKTAASMFFMIAIFIFALSQLAHAANTLSEVVVTAKESNQLADDLSGVSGAKIYNGKKTTLIDLQKAPTNVNSNYRKAFGKTPSLLLAEESNALFSVGYRGLPPGRAQYIQVLMDGIPIAADVVGYPEAYYTPPLDTVDHIDFIRGGASLIYGPQPGGALNFVTKQPYSGGPLQFTTSNAGGSHGLYSNYTSFSGTKEKTGYLGYFHHRQTQGFREVNSQMSVFDGGVKIQYALDEKNKLGFSLDAFNEEHGIPGGLTRADFDADSTKSTKRMDHFEMDRYAGAMNYGLDISDDTYLEAKAFGGYFQRKSWAQRGGGFGLIPSGGASSTSDIEFQEFYTTGVETRLKKDYLIGEIPNIWTGGVLYYHGFSPRLDKRTVTVDADNGPIRKNSERTSNYLALFMENMVKINKLTLIPGFRFENIWQSLKELQNDDKTTVPLLNETVYSGVPLFGLGSTYDITEKTQVYANISQGYRPMTFTQAVPTGANQTINNDLEEGKSWQLDVGLRGNPVPFYTWDMGYFLMRFEDQIGTSGTTIENVGDATHQGVEGTTTLDMIGAFDTLAGSNAGDKLGKLNIFGNVMILDARFTKGPNKGKTPQYAPDFIFKAGLEYDYKSRAKIQLAGTFVDDHFANDTNTTQFLVPSYKVWDLTADVKVCKNISLFAAINNVFNEHYFARVAADGIDPADGRNYYGGVKIVW
jgi:Fe(3+) dicitrate transport protein